MNKVKVIKDNFKALKNYYSKECTLDNMPSFFWLEPTNHCNLRCVMCPNGTGQINIEKGYMEYDLYKGIIDDISDYASAITLAVGGESLLHPRFFDMARYAADKGIKVLLNTNATLLNKEKAMMMLDSGVSSISFAFDGFTKRMYEKVRVGANFETTLDNILYFLWLKKEKKKKLPYAVLSILMLGLEECGEGEQRYFLKKFEGLIEEVRLREVSTWGNTFKGTQDFSYRKNDFNYPPCSRLLSTAVITWNGDVVPCIYDTNHEYVIGNLRDKDLRFLWNSEKMLQLRKAMIHNKYLDILPLCDNCIVLGTPPLFGIPSGIRLTLTDSVTNIVGHGFEKVALRFANIVRKGKFTSKTIEI